MSFEFTFRAFSRSFFPKRPTISMFVRRETTIYPVVTVKLFIETSGKHLQVNPFPYTTEIARMRRYTMLSNIFKCQDVRHTISVYIKCQDVRHTISVYIKCLCLH